MDDTVYLMVCQLNNPMMANVVLMVTKGGSRLLARATVSGLNK